jgi:hypothetical protein
MAVCGFWKLREHSRALLSFLRLPYPYLGSVRDWVIRSWGEVRVVSMQKSVGESGNVCVAGESRVW